MQEISKVLVKVPGTDLYLSPGKLLDSVQLISFWAARPQVVLPLVLLLASWILFDMRAGEEDAGFMLSYDRKTCKIPLCRPCKVPVMLQSSTSM